MEDQHEKPVEQQAVADVAPQYDYKGTNVQIGSGFGGMVPLAQRGTLTIGQGELSLFDDAGQLINKALLGVIEVKPIFITMGATAWVHMADKRYSVAISHGDFMVGNVAPLPGLTLGVSSSATKDFIKIFKQLSGK